MCEKTQYPAMRITLAEMYENAKNIVRICAERGIKVSAVVKGTDSYEHSYRMVADTVFSAGCISVADSRMNTIKRMRECGFDKEVLLIRIPMPSELDDVVNYANCSLQSDADVLHLTDAAAKKHKVKHGVILMMDLGDLREGFFDEEELIESAYLVETELANLHLKGIGTNLGCYGAVCPDENNLGRLVEIARKVEKRIGEAIVLSRDLIDLWNYELPFMHQDVYSIYAEVIEIRRKATRPIGKTFVDAFGNKPYYEDRGIRKRALLALGKRDIGSFDSLIPTLEGAEIVGGSSDHLILDVEEVKEEIRVGDVLKFNLFYGGMLYASNSNSVTKVYVE